MKNSKAIDMLNGNLWVEIIRFSLPVMASGFLQLLFNATDLIVVGNECGSIMLGAVGATSAINMLIINFFVGFSMGVSVVVSNGLGENNWKKVNRAVHACIPLALAFGISVGAIGYVITPGLLTYMKTPETLFPYSVTYLRILFIGMPITLIYNYGASVLKANGDTKKPLYYLAIAGIVNILLNICFCRVFKMDVDGVAWATVISNALAAFLTVREMASLTNCCRLQFKYMRFYTHACLRILKIGIPAGVSSSMFAFSNIIVQSYLNSYGDAVVTGNTAAQSINGFQLMLLSGISTAAVNFVGQNYGAQKYDRIKKIKHISMIYTILVAAISATILIAFSDFFLGIYITDSAEAIEIGRIKLIICAVFTVVNCMFDILAATMRGIGQSLIPAIISIVCICGVRLLYIFTIYQMPAFHNITGLFYCYPISWAAAFLVSIPITAIVEKKRFAYHTEHMEEFSKDTFRDPKTKD